MSRELKVTLEMSLSDLRVSFRRYAYELGFNAHDSHMMWDKFWEQLKQRPTVKTIEKKRVE